jgi:hypothetical protein
VNYTLFNKILQKIQKQFAKTKLYRFSKQIFTPLENRLIYENSKQIEKAKKIDRVSKIDNKLKPFLLTIMPVNPEQQRKTTKYLSSKGIPYFGTIEFSKKNAPHLHLTIYLKTIKESLEIEKELYRKLKIIKPRKKKGLKRVEPIHIQLMKDEIDEKEKHKEEKVKNKYPQYYSIKTMFLENRILQNMKNGDEASLEEYFKQKALLSYFNFKRRFLSSKVPPKYANPRIEANKLKKQVEKLRNIEKLDGEKYILEIPNLPKEGQSRIKKYLSNRKVKYFAKMEMQRKIPIFKIVVNIPRNWQKNLLEFSPREIVRIENISQEFCLKTEVAKETNLKTEVAKETNLKTEVTKETNSKTEVTKETNSKTKTSKMKIFKETTKNWIKKIGATVKLLEKKDMLSIKRYSEQISKLKTFLLL